MGTDGWTGRCQYGSRVPFLMERAAGASQSIPLPRILEVLELQLLVASHGEDQSSRGGTKQDFSLSLHMVLGMVFPCF